MISVFHVEQLSSLLKSFYTVSQIRITVFDDSFTEIAAYPPDVPGFCACIRRQKEGLAACRASDRAAFNMAKRRTRPYIYECPAGLLEAIYPIEMSHIIIGYMMFGHIAPRENPDDGWEMVRGKCLAGETDQDRLQEEFRGLRYFSREYLEASAQIMETVTSYLCTKRMASLKYDSLAVQIDRYITEHLAEEISCESICERFEISRTSLYQLSNEVYGVGIASHIRNARMEKARQLLSDTDLPVRAVAMECGIRDYNYFGKMFRKSTGYTPGEYRRLG